jgi:hypothetical protein
VVDRAPREERVVKRFIPRAIAIALFSSAALAQSVTQSIGLTWTAPTKNTDGSAITGTLTYTLFQGPTAGPFVQVATGLSGTSSTVTSTAAGNCFALAAVETQGATSTASAPSPTVCALIPAGPSGLTISITISVK